MGTVIVIPARGGSKGILRKNLQLVNNKPLISYAIEIAHNVKSVDMAIVSTEDDEIAEVSDKYGAKVVNRPFELAEDHVNLLPVNQHILKYLSEQGIYPERVISLQPTAPLLKPETIEEGIQLHIKTGCDAVCSVALIEHNHPCWAKNLNPLSGELSDFFEIDGDKFLQKQDLPECYSYTGGFYIRRRDVLEKGKGKGLGKDVRGIVVDREEALDIDNMLDLEFFRFLINRREIKS